MSSYFNPNQQPGYNQPPAAGSGQPNYIIPQYPPQGHQYPPQAQQGYQYPPQAQQGYQYSPQAQQGYQYSPQTPQGHQYPPQAQQGYQYPPQAQQGGQFYYQQSSQQGYIQPTPAASPIENPLAPRNDFRASAKILTQEDILQKLKSKCTFFSLSPSSSSAAAIDEGKKIPNLLHNRIKPEVYKVGMPKAGEVLYYLNEDTSEVHYKYLSISGIIKEEKIALVNLSRMYLFALPEQSQPSEHGSVPHWPREFTQRLNEAICKEIQNKYINNLTLEDVYGGNYGNAQPDEGQILCFTNPNVIQCKYWAIEDTTLTLVEKQYDRRTFLGGNGQVPCGKELDSCLKDRISEEVKLVFDLAEYRRTIDQEISNTLGDLTKRAKREATGKLLVYLKDTSKAPNFSEEEKKAIYEGSISRRLGDLANRAKALYPDLEEMLRPASPTPRK